MRVIAYILTFCIIAWGCQKDVGIQEEDEKLTQNQAWKPLYCPSLLGTYQMTSYCSFFDITNGLIQPDTLTATFSIDTTLEMNRDTFAKASASFITFFDEDNFDPGIYLMVENGTLVLHSERVNGRLMTDSTCDAIIDGGYQFEYFDALWDCDSVWAVKIL